MRLGNLPTLRQLQCFISIAEEGSFRRAAEQLSLSQPPLSRQIQLLEHLLGTKLFVRKPHGIELTVAGRCFLKRVRSVLANLEMATMEIRPGPGQQQLSVTIGVTTVVDVDVLPDLGEILLACNTDAVLHVERMFSRDLIDNLVKNRIDLALIGLPSNVPVELMVNPLYSEPMIIAMAEIHPKAQMPDLALRDLEDTPLFWFARSQNPSFYEHCERFFCTTSFAPIRLSVPESNHVLLGLIARNEGFALLPASRTLIQRSGVIYRQLPSDAQAVLRVTIGLAFRPERMEEPLIAVIAEAIHYAFLQNVKLGFGR